MSCFRNWHDFAEFEVNLNGVTKELAHCGSVDSIAVHDSRHAAPGTSRNKTYQHKCARWLGHQGWCPRESGIGKNAWRKGNHGESHDIESTKEKMLDADPNLERNMRARQGLEKILCILGYIMRRQKLLKLLLMSFAQRKRTL